MFGPEKCPVYIKLPYISSAYNWFRTAVQKADHNEYHNSRAVVIFHAWKMFPNMSKAVLLMLAVNVFGFLCNRAPSTKLLLNLLNIGGAFSWGLSDRSFVNYLYV